MTATALKWGVDPLPEQIRLADLLREVTSLVLSQESSGPELADLIRSLSIARTVLAGSAPLGDDPRVGRRADGSGRVYIDHCSDIHAWNPMFPAYAFDHLDADSATGTVCFPICYEGPAGGVNGGVLGVFFDAVVQHHNCALGVSGATRDLNIRYHQMTPLLTDLAFEISRTMEERSILSEVRLLDAGEVVSSAVTRAAIFERTNPPIVSPRR